MKKRMVQYISLLALSTLLGACGASTTSDQSESVGKEEQVSQESHAPKKDESIKIEGLADHYHTGSSIELTATLESDIETPHWHWYTRETEDAEWETASGQQTQDFIGEAATNGLEIKAALVDDDHEIYAESEPVTITINDHHGGTEADQKIADGYFEDEQVENRELTDFAGDWQSVYPYLLSGDLDEVFEHKAEENGDKTAKEYKEYYATAYETTIERMVIEGDTVTFYEDGKETAGTYENDGFEILDKGDGKKGVRFAYKLVEGPEELPEYILFSDHFISPNESFHYHLYAGDNRNNLIEKSNNWPTFYPAELDAKGIVSEMLAH